MRTTMTLEPDVAERLRQEMRRTGKGMKAVVNDGLRLGLGVTSKRGHRAKFVVEPRDLGVRPGFDLDRMNQLVDELEVEEVTRRHRR